MPKLVFHAALLALLVSGPLLAQPTAPYLVKDLNQSGPAATSSAPAPLGTVGGRAVFVTSNGQLWASDGTPGGTILLRDDPSFKSRTAKDGNASTRVLKATGGHLFLLDRTEVIRRLLVTDGTPAGTMFLADGAIPGPLLPENYFWSDSLQLLFFSAYDREHGTEPWVSDGTPAGTHLLRDINEGPASSVASFYVALGSRVLFHAVPQTGHPFHFWLTDGTDAGTSPVPGSENLYGLDFASIGKKVVYIPYTPSTLELWVTDGTSRGVQLLKVPGAGEDWGLYFLGASPGRLYFYSDEGKSGFHLWTSDGTPAGTRALGRFPRTANLYGEPQSLRFLPNGTALLFIDDVKHGMEWWRSDGTTAGTRLLKDVCPGRCSAVSFLTGRPLLIGKKLFAHLVGPAGEEPWMTDGTEAGTRQIADTCPGACSSNTAFSPSRTAVSGLEIYSARVGSPTAELEVWRTNGTSSGTFRLTQSQHSKGFQYLPAIALGDQLLFDNDDGVHGMELWATNGTIAGTRLVADLDAAGAGSAPDQMTAVGDRVFFIADDGVHGPALWVSNGTPGGTILLHALSAPPALPFPSPFSNLTAGNGFLIFALKEGEEPARLWVSDGTVQGTRPIGDVIPELPATMPLGHRLLFPASNGLWATDGTVGGTVLVTNRVSIDYYSSPPEFVPLGDTLLFAGRGQEGNGVWKTDGTDAGTVLVKALLIDSIPWTTLGGKAYFSASGPEGDGLYESDGTAAGTRHLEAPVAPIYQLTAAGGRLFVFTRPSSNPIELFVSDGTAAGTHKLGEMEIGLHGSKLTAAGNQVFFVASDSAHGTELWRSDGTEAGTFMIQDIRPGTPSSVLEHPVAIGGLVYFRAFDGQHGSELWRSDGTPGGTFRVAEIASGPRSADPQQLTPAGPRLFFSANDGAHGQELWALCLTPACSSAP
jgi:ELWxxDGT repeat protein